MLATAAVSEAADITLHVVPGEERFFDIAGRMWGDPLSSLADEEQQFRVFCRMLGRTKMEIREKLKWKHAQVTYAEGGPKITIRDLVLVIHQMFMDAKLGTPPRDTVALILQHCGTFCACYRPFDAR